MDISIEVVYCLDITEICKPRFSGASCFYICRLDPHVCYDVVGEKQENFVILFASNVDPWQIKIKLFYHFNFFVVVVDVFL